MPSSSRLTRWKHELTTVSIVRTAVSPETGRGRLASGFAERRWPALVVLAACACLASVAIAFDTAPLPAVGLLRLAAYLRAARVPRPVSSPAVWVAAARDRAALRGRGA